MNIEQKISLDLIDEVYTLARWMAGSAEEAEALALSVFSEVGPDAPKREVLGAFRAACIRRYGNVPAHAPGFPVPVSRALRLIGEQDVDRKLSVLFSEVCGLGHEGIAALLGRPLGRIRQMLSLGRQWLVHGFLALFSLVYDQGTRDGLLFMGI